MKSIGLVIATAFITFTLTDIDDLCLLIVFFARARIASDPMQVSNVIIGQSLGFTILVSISLLGIVLGAFLPASYVALIGFVPILMGLKMAYEKNKDVCAKKKNMHAVGADDVIEMTTTNPVEGGISPVQQSPSESPEQSKQSFPVEMQENRPSPVEKQENHSSLVETTEEEEDGNDSWLAKAAGAILKNCLSPHTLEVCTITIANGGDNVSVYLPLFASYPPSSVVVTLIVFFGMLCLWIAMTYLFTGSKIIRDFLTTYGEKLVPFFLIGLGVYILSDSVLFEQR